MWWSSAECACLSIRYCSRRSSTFGYLMELVERHGQQCWYLIATFLTGRICKQCRKRSYNHLRLNIKVSITHLRKPH
ncbi:unnamed protein product [Sphagnum troendelagicum]|uniref:HTH myb-type domain-containing protein n=1 Tax=Sphagnum troendelagicum TaxID=128251 RepID=A0ABP0TD67_9BRYO